MGFCGSNFNSDGKNKLQGLWGVLGLSCAKSLYAITLLLFLLNTPCFAFTDNQLANAIYKAENSKSHPYGILTHYKTTTPRQACLNTIAHAKRDWNGKGDFIVFLGNRYAPINSDTDNGTNKFWVSNVKYFLNKEAK